MRKKRVRKAKLALKSARSQIAFRAARPTAHSPLSYLISAIGT
jgi:hypothetical protein